MRVSALHIQLNLFVISGIFPLPTQIQVFFKSLSNLYGTFSDNFCCSENTKKKFFLQFPLNKGLWEMLLCKWVLTFVKWKHYFNVQFDMDVVVLRPIIFSKQFTITITIRSQEKRYFVHWIRASRWKAVWSALTWVEPPLRQPCIIASLVTRRPRLIWSDEVTTNTYISFYPFINILPFWTNGDRGHF